MLFNSLSDSPYAQIRVRSLIFYSLTSIAFSQSKDELVVKLKRYRQILETAQKASNKLSKSSSSNIFIDIINQIHFIKNKLKTYSVNLDNPIYFDNDVILDQNLDLLDFYIYDYSTNYYEVHARLKNKQRVYLDWVKLRYNIYLKGAFVGTDYTYIDFETYGYSGMSPYKYSFVETYIEKAAFDSIAYQIEYDVENGEDYIMWDQILNLQSVIIQSFGNLFKWQGVVNNNHNYSMKFPKIYACVFKNQRMVSTDYTYLDVQNDSLPPNSSGVFDSFIDLPSDYDEIKYYLNYSLYSLNGSGNLPPNIPIITRNNYNGMSREHISFDFFSIDPNSDRLYLCVDFGDGSSLNWQGFFTSGLNATIQHSFMSDGHYNIMAKLRDIGNLETAWSESRKTLISKSTSPQIVNTNLDTSYYMNSFSQQLIASNGIQPYIWKIIHGSLPNGLNLNSNNGFISGLPKKSGSFNFTISVTDAGIPELSDTSSFDLIVINNCPIITSDDTLYTYTNTKIVYVASAADPDGNSITYNFLNYPLWLSKTNTILHGTTPNTPLDTSFSVIATDGDLNDTLKVILIINDQTSVATQESTPKFYTLYQNYPNPFNPNTNIKIDLPKATFLSILIYDIDGRIVSNIFKGRLESGHHYFKWNAIDIPSGMYFIKVQSSVFTKTIKCLLLK